MARFKHGNSVPQPQNDVTTMREKHLATLAGPFSMSYVPIFALSSNVYSLFFNWLRDKTTLE